VLLPLTGDLATIGKDIERGLRIALKNNADFASSVDLLVEDITTFNPVNAVKSAQRLLNIEKVDLAVTAIMQDAEPMAPIFNKKKVPLIVLWDNNELIRNLGEYIFTSGFLSEYAGELAAQFVVSAKRATGSVIIMHQDLWSELIGDAFEKEFKKLGGKILAKESLPATTTDYRTLLARIKSKNPAIIYCRLIWLCLLNKQRN